MSATQPTAATGSGRASPPTIPASTNCSHCWPTARSPRSPADRRGPDGAGSARPHQHGQHGGRRDGALRTAARRPGGPRSRRGARDESLRLRAGELPPADHPEHLAGGTGQDLCGRCAGGRLLPEIADVLPDEVAGVVRAVLGRPATRSSSSPRFARRCCPAAASAAGWRCGRAGCSARPSPRRSTCWPTTTNWSTWCSPARRAGPGHRLLRPAAAHPRRPDAPARPGLIHRLSGYTSR